MRPLQPSELPAHQPRPRYALHRKRTATAEIVRHNSVLLNKTQLCAKKQERHNSVTSESSETQLRAKITKRHNSVRFGAKRHNSVTSSEKRHNFVMPQIYNNG